MQSIGVFSLMQWSEDRAPRDVYRDEIAQAVEAEAMGYDRAWFAEHHFSRYGIDPAIHLTAAHVAALTTRIRLGTAVTIVPFLHPIRLAEELATLDLLSDGRLDWGAGRGYQRHEFDAFEIDIEESRDRFQEALEIVFAAWGDKPIRHRGRFWKFDEVDVLPKPVQGPGIPTWIAAISPSSIEWAGREGLPYLADQFTSIERLHDARATFTAARADAGHAGDGEAGVLRQVFVADSTERAREIAGPALLWYYRMLAAVGSPKLEAEAGLPSGYDEGKAYALFGKLSGLVAPGSSDDFLDVLLDEVAVVGSAEEVVDKLTGLGEAGYSTLLAWMNFGGIPHEATMDSMRRFVDDVAPSLPR